MGSLLIIISAGGEVIEEMAAGSRSATGIHLGNIFHSILTSGIRTRDMEFLFLAGQHFDPYLSLHENNPDHNRYISFQSVAFFTTGHYKRIRFGYLGTYFTSAEQHHDPSAEGLLSRLLYPGG